MIGATRLSCLATLLVAFVACRSRDAPLVVDAAPPVASSAATAFEPPKGVRAFVEARDRAGAMIESSRRVRDLGFGARLLSDSVIDMDSSCRRSAIERGGKTISLEGECRPRKQEVDAGSVERWEDPKAMADFRDAVAAVLGKPELVEPPPELRTAYEAVASPFADDEFGASCGVGGAPPMAHLATRALVDAKRLDLLRAITRGTSPEGRVYAMRALMQAPGAMTPDDKLTLAALRKLDPIVTACMGCNVAPYKTSKLLDWNEAKCPSCAPE